MKKSDRINVALKETDMKKCVVFMAAVVLMSLLPFRVSAQVAINETHFPDSVFRAYVQENFDTDRNGSLSEAECEAVRSIDVSGEYDSLSSLSDLSGIENFPNLEELACDYTELTSLDVSQSPVLKALFCLSTGITSLDVSRNPALVELDCSNTELTSLDVSQNSALENLYCYNTGITSLDVSQNLGLKFFDCHNTGLTSLDVSQHRSLLQFDCSSTGITSLDVSNSPALMHLYVNQTRLGHIDVSRNPNLISLRCQDNTDLTSLDVSQNPKLERLYCSNTGLTSLDVSQNLALTYLEVNNTKLSHIDLSQNPALQTVQLQGNIHSVNAEVGGTYDLSLIPGFDLSRVTWNSNTEIEGSLLRFTTESIAYEYDIRLGGNEYKVAFTLKAVPDLAAEGQSEPVSFRAWTESGQLHLEGTEGMVEVFDLGGRCLYRGQSSVIPLPGSGIYLVRNQGRSQKVVNL